MTKKKLVLEFTFKEQQDTYDPEYTYLELTKIERTGTLEDWEIDSLGEEIGQTDRWQVNRWIDIQRLLGDSDTKKVKIK